MEQSDARFFCEVGGAPTPVITWKRGIVCLQSWSLRSSFLLCSEKTALTVSSKKGHFDEGLFLFKNNNLDWYADDYFQKVGH